MNFLDEKNIIDKKTSNNNVVDVIIGILLTINCIMSDHLTDEEVGFSLKNILWNRMVTLFSNAESYCEIARWMWSCNAREKLQDRRFETTEEDDEEVVAWRRTKEQSADVVGWVAKKASPPAWCNRIIIAWQNIFCLQQILWSDCLTERNWLWQILVNAWPLDIQSC
jgi:hypothetical protein